MKIKTTAAVVMLFCALCWAQEADGVKFEFKYQTGDHYRILSTVDEDVFINRARSHHSVIINRVSAEVTAVDKDGVGTHNCTFMTSENSSSSFSGASFSYGEEYKSVFKRTKLGVYDISDEYFMPTVRDVPVFPDRTVKPGERWTAAGHEAHDMRQGFGIPTPFRVPFTAEYTYEGVDAKTGLHRIRAKYSMKMESPRMKSNTFDEYPVLTQGFSDELIFWDNEKGAIDHYTETFRIFIETSLGNLYEFSGVAQAEVTDFAHSSTEENVVAVQEKVEEMGLENVTVKSSEKGLTIAIENIQFQPNSSVLTDKEKEKIKQIARILESWPDNDILVSGHTALAGTESARQRLSEQRAQAVADYLVDLKVRDRYHVFTQGFGATQPISENDTEEGKSKNRRVEITIMDK